MPWVMGTQTALPNPPGRQIVAVCPGIGDQPSSHGLLREIAQALADHRVEARHFAQLLNHARHNRLYLLPAITKVHQSGHRIVGVTGRSADGGRKAWG